mmetsp:Transcript_26729/g.39532  ORF Transcript_26729/g.39532 Transcript_26729/m.39532 type:complete len:225 (-) Transcript_26729:95-769(-)|eukprot:CAMPEP_0194212022 /NCGR_PEP_ID=MMETSP0156-20130528/11546_1 /TAXON_ID=33649 /ORGANISM="Thalassionema nitzschioides, Strain L26-B" /LENGTH=224 /DNA_ID=CAMNT_0038939733 /DNA_START=85 /DNA_END=759 /DNA_ORIENTATION=+
MPRHSKSFLHNILGGPRNSSKKEGKRIVKSSSSINVISSEEVFSEIMDQQEQELLNSNIPVVETADDVAAFEEEEQKVVCKKGMEKQQQSTLEITAKTDNNHHQQQQNNQLHQHQRRVSFSNLHIREHSITLGDHPSCAIPITLGWDICHESTSSIDDYEKSKQQQQHCLSKLSFGERRELLADELTDVDCRRAQRKVSREKRNCHREQAAFFAAAATTIVTAD